MSGPPLNSILPGRPVSSRYGRRRTLRESHRPERPNIGCGPWTIARLLPIMAILGSKDFCQDCLLLRLAYTLQL